MHEPADALRNFGERVRELRTSIGISQEELGFRSSLDRTYISDIERGQRNLGLLNIHALARALQVGAEDLFGGAAQPSATVESPAYRLRDGFNLECGFQVTGTDVHSAALETSEELQALPFSLFRSIDLKALSGIVGALFATHIARSSGAIVNPIEKGHPDVIPAAGADASEEALRNYGSGLEIKCTVGGVEKGSNLSSGQRRLDRLTGITWQAHHREVHSLMGLVIDFAGKETGSDRYPVITGIFFSDALVTDDWGKISGTTGRNTKVTGMLSSGKAKMGSGWVLLLDDQAAIDAYSGILNFQP